MWKQQILKEGYGLKIYMDVCCLNRPFDDLSQDRIYLEAEAVLTIISHCRRSHWVLFSSDVIDFELSKSRDINKLEKVQALYAVSKEHYSISPQIERRAKFFQQHGIKVLDSLHLALAEIYQADVLLTADDRFLRSASRIDLGIKISNPVSWLMEVTRK